MKNLLKKEVIWIWKTKSNQLLVNFNQLEKNKHKRNLCNIDNWRLSIMIYCKNNKQPEK